GAAIGSLLLAHVTEGRQVGGEALARGCADHARLRHIRVARAAVEQRQRLAVVAGGGVIGQYCAHELSTLRVEGQVQHVGIELNVLRLRGGSGRRIAWNRGRRGRSRGGGGNA